PPSRGCLGRKEAAMRLPRAFPAAAFMVFLTFATVRISICQQTAAITTHDPSVTPNVAVEPQYDTTHVYVAPKDFDRLVASVLATFGGTTSKQVVTTVTPTPSSTISQLILTPVGTKIGRASCRERWSN